jgi:hypothetical protein
MPHMTDAAKVLSTRLTAAELEEFEELGRRLGTNPTDTIKLAIKALRNQTGLDRFDAIALYERIAREHGDDCKVKFKILDIESQEVEVTVNGEPVEDLEAHVLYLVGKLRRAGKIVPPTEGMITAKDLQTGNYYSIGQIMLKVGSIKEIPLSKLPDLLQDDSDLRPEERRDHIRKNAQIRAAARRARGEDVEED